MPAYYCGHCKKNILHPGARTSRAKFLRCPTCHHIIYRYKRPLIPAEEPKLIQRGFPNPSDLKKERRLDDDTPDPA